jgi:hypothetical protein
MLKALNGINHGSVRLHLVVKLFTELGNVMLLRPEDHFVQV